jgi:large subunit ribosomal protein L16
MGKGKGSPSFWVCRVQPGQMLYEMDGIPASSAEQAAKLAYHKLPLKTAFVQLEDQDGGN